MGKELWEIGLFGDRSENEAAVRELQETGYIRYEDLPLETKNKQRVDVEVVANIYQENRQRVIQCNIRDITARSRMEKKLQEQTVALADLHRRKDEFLAMLSHELRSPLAPIYNAVQILRLQDKEDPLQHQGGRTGGGAARERFGRWHFSIAAPAHLRSLHAGGTLARPRARRIGHRPQLGEAVGGGPARRPTSETPWRGEFDLIEGLAGICLYGLERLPLGDGRELLETAATRLYEVAEIRVDGSAWLTAPERLIPMRRKQYPTGNFNLGLAHGVPGIVGALACAEAAGIPQPQHEFVLRDAVRWLRSQRLSTGEKSQFPYWVGSGIPPQPTRLAWCYGDLGIALALHTAGVALGEASWRYLALEIARAAAVRPFDTCEVVDAGLCHGAAGLGHMFNRLFQSTGEELFREAALFWLGRTLGFRRPGEGVGGFIARGPDRAGQETWLAEPGLLTGAAGVGLALLSAATHIEPRWDRLLLCSTRDDLF